MTQVIFRMSEGECVAVFPRVLGDNRDNVTCYQHIGQHGACSRTWYQTTTAASAEQARALRAELESIGYVLDVRTRWAR